MLVKCVNCIYLHAETEEWCGKQRKLHTCRIHPPILREYEAFWPQIDVDSGCCGDGKQANKQRKGLQSDR